MKNQYFGDIGDYKKFSLLRVLGGNNGLRITVCWMLTEDDGSNDGRFTHYLKTPGSWRGIDKDVYDLLQTSVLQKQKRDLKIVEQSGLIHNSIFFSKQISDETLDRTTFFNELWDASKDTDVIFFDPDNGIEVASVTYGKKGSRKYIFWHELEEAYSRNYGLIVYQHFPRVDRDKYIRQCALSLLGKLKIKELFAVRTRHAAFFIIPSPNKVTMIRERLDIYVGLWKDHVKVTFHSPGAELLISQETQLDLF